jgi:hypothetical protein
MALHLPHADVGFGVTFNAITKDAAFYTTTSRFVAWLGAFSQERQGLWLPKDDLKDSSSWSSPPLVLLRNIHNGLLANYDCKDSAPSPAQPGARARSRRNSQDGVSQQEEAAPLFLLQLNRLHEAYIVRGEDASNIAVAAILAQNRLSQQIISLLKTSSRPRGLTSCRAALPSHAAAHRGHVEDSILRTEMGGLESQEEDTQRGSCGINQWVSWG